MQCSNCHRRLLHRQKLSLAPSLKVTIVKEGRCWTTMSWTTSYSISLYLLVLNISSNHAWVQKAHPTDHLHFQQKYLPLYASCCLHQKEMGMLDRKIPPSGGRHWGLIGCNPLLAQGYQHFVLLLPRRLLKVWKRKKRKKSVWVRVQARLYECVYYYVPVPVHEPPPRLITCDGDMRIGEVSDCQRTAGPRFNWVMPPSKAKRPVACACGMVSAK